MPPLPPAQDVLDAMEYAVVPAAGAAAPVMSLLLLAGRRAGPLASAAAVVAGFGFANYTARHLGTGDGPLLPWGPGESAKPWHFLPRTALVLVVAGLLTRWIGLLASRHLPERRWWVANALVWTPRFIAVGVACHWLVSERAAAEQGWLVPALGSVMLLEWVALDGIARSEPGGRVAAYQGAVFFAAGALLLYHHWASASFVAVMVGSAMVGAAVVAALARADASGTVPVSVGFLPGLLLSGRLSMDSQIPLVAFWLVALAPCLLLPFLVPALARRRAWSVQLVRAVLVLAPLAVALVLAARHEQLAFEE